MIPVGTKVTVVEQPILVSWVGDDLYLEADPSRTQSIDIEINGDHQVKPLTDALKKVIINAAGIAAERIDWEVVKKTVEERTGVPVAIASSKEKPPPPPKEKSMRVEYKYKYN